MGKYFYITTTLPYVNAEPHIGFAAEIIKADVIARWQRQLGREVFFNTGTDEHGLKIYRKAREQGKDPQVYCDEYAAKFNKLKNVLNLSYNNFIRTTDPQHIKAAQAFWEKCEEAGDIYKENYRIKYCVGCELEKTESELAGGRCPHHPNSELEIIEEENYFFRWSKYQDKLLKFYKENPDFVLPEHRLHEIKNFVESGLQDFSISRLKEKMPWGIPVPGDENHVMYVWFDALVNYISALGWPSSVPLSGTTEGKPVSSKDKLSKNEDLFKKFWPVVQVAGKDNLKQQAAMWQAMLMSAGISPSKQILIFGFLTSGGQKMSKSLGNVINPFALVEKYGTDAVRYYLLAEILPFEDGDFSYAKFADRFNADLANGLGNLVARVSNLLEKNEIKIKIKPGSDKKLEKGFSKKMAEYRFDEVLKILWDRLRAGDKFLSAKAPWKIKNKDEVKKILERVAKDILNVAFLLQPFLPETAGKIIKQYSAEQIRKGEELFPRIVG